MLYITNIDFNHEKLEVYDDEDNGTEIISMFDFLRYYPTIKDSVANKSYSRYFYDKDSCSNDEIKLIFGLMEIYNRANISKEPVLTSILKLLDMNDTMKIRQNLHPLSAYFTNKQNGTITVVSLICLCSTRYSEVMDYLPRVYNLVQRSHIDFMDIWHDDSEFRRLMLGYYHDRLKLQGYSFLGESGSRVNYSSQVLPELSYINLCDKTIQVSNKTFRCYEISYNTVDEARYMYWFLDYFMTNSAISYFNPTDFLGAIFKYNFSKEFSNSLNIICTEGKSIYVSPIGTFISSTKLIKLYMIGGRNNGDA